MSTLVGTLMGLPSGGEVQLSAEGHQFTVTYHAEQAVGDDNRPARGYTTGLYTLTRPGGIVTYHRHSPWQATGWSSLARVSAAEDVANAVGRWVREHRPQEVAR